MRVSRTQIAGAVIVLGVILLIAILRVFFTK